MKTVKFTHDDGHEHTDTEVTRQAYLAGPWEKVVLCTRCWRVLEDNPQ